MYLRLVNQTNDPVSLFTEGAFLLGASHSFFVPGKVKYGSDNPKHK